MKIFLISQKENNGYDTYDSAVVVANNEDQAKRMYPSGVYKWKDNVGWISKETDTEPMDSLVWCNSIESVKVEYIGTANDGIKEAKVILASYNAG